METIETEKILTAAEMFGIVGDELREKNAEIERLRLANSDLQMHYDHARTECDKLREVLKELEWQLKNQLYDASYETVIHTLWPQLKEKE